MWWLIQCETSAATKGSVAAPSYQSVSLFIKCLGNIAFGSAVSPALRSDQEGDRGNFPDCFNGTKVNSF
jgi:hypothetical protein